MPGKRTRKAGIRTSSPLAIVAVPTEAYDLSQLDIRQYRGYEMYMASLAPGGTKKISVAYLNADMMVYISSRDRNRAYTVARAVRNIRGAKKVEYTCSCRDFAKHMRGGCKHVFCERLRRKEATTYGDPPKRAPRLAAKRNPARVRFCANGKSVRANQRLARMDMPVRIPELVDTMVKAEDIALRERHVAEGVAEVRKRGGQMTTDSTRSGTLVLKVSKGVSADEMVVTFDEYIRKGILRLNAPPHQNSLSDWMNDSSLEPMLDSMFHRSTLPFRAEETVGIIDSTKLSNAQTAHYRGVEYLRDDRPFARWLKCHVMSGLESNAVLAYRFSRENVHDSMYYEDLVKDAMRTFALKHVLADKA